MAHSLSKLALSLPSCSAAFALLANGAMAQLTWSPISVGTPPARSAAAAASALSDDEVFVFGGLNVLVPLGDTWRFTGQTWTQMFPAASPSPRSHHAMTAFGSRCVLFGGRDSNSAALGDLWLWDPASQTWQPGPAGPAAREGAAMAVAPLLFGGHTGTQMFNDLWWLSPALTWQNVTPATGSPSPRYGHALVYVEQFPQHWLLFGGVDGAGNHLAETWRLDQPGGTHAWTQLSPATSPSARSGHGMRWSRHRGRIQLFGGEGPAGLLGDSWEWDGASWVPITTNGAPAARADAVFVDVSAALPQSPGLLIGGRDASGPRAEAWQVTSTAPASIFQFGSVLSTLLITRSGWPWVGGSFTVGVYSSGTPVALPHVIAGFNNSMSSAGPLPLNLGPGFNNQPLLVDPVALLPLTGSGTSVQTTIAVPPVPSLVGARLYLQGIAYLPSWSAFPGWNLTSGLDCHLGWL